MARREFVVAAAILLDARGRVLLVGNDWQGQGGVDHLAYAVHVEDKRRNDRAVSFAFKARYTGLLNPRDPDGFIVEARFVPLPEVRTLVPIPPLRDPLVNYLSDGVAGRFYSYAGWDGRGARRV